MSVRSVLLVLCALASSACAPGLVLRSPSVEGTVTDAHTHRPLSQVFVAVIRGRNGLSVGPLPNGLTDARGHFYLAAQCEAGLLNVGPGYPLPEEIGLSIGKDGYRPTTATVSFAHAEAHISIALEPDRGTVARSVR